MLRIYADFNGLVNGPVTPKHEAVVLDTFGSLRDLANAGVILSDGLSLIAWDASDADEDLEGHGLARFDRDNNWWVVEFDEQGVRYVPCVNRETVTEFKCVACSKRLDELIKKNGLKEGDVCPSCATPIHSSLAPPI